MKTLPPRIQQYVEYVEKLYTDIEKWLQSASVKVQHHPIEIEEGASDSYTLEKLMIIENENIISEIIPIGSNIIGADGRIDIKGFYDKQSIILFTHPPKYTSKVIQGNEFVEKEVDLYKNIEKSGWYWIENPIRSTATAVTRDVFLDLLSEVSGYDFK